MNAIGWSKGEVQACVDVLEETSVVAAIEIGQVHQSLNSFFYIYEQLILEGSTQALQYILAAKIVT